MAVRTILGDRLKITSEALRLEYHKLSELQAAELNAKAAVYQSELGRESVAAIDKLTTVHTVSLAGDILKSKGRVAALEEERDHIRFCIKYNLEG